MAKTAFATDNALTKKLWDEKLFRDTVKEAYWNRFMGKADDVNSIVAVKEELTKQKGDNITFGIRMRLAGAGVVSGETLEGNEEKLVTHDYSVSLEQYRHGVRDAGALDRQRAMFSIDVESKQALQDWGSEKIDSLLFAAAVASCTKIFYGGDATATTDLEAGDKITPDLISKVKAWAKTGGNRAQTPLRPVKIEGKTYFVLLLHPDEIYDLRLNSVWAQAARDALPAGVDHPIFSGASYLWDGVVIHDHENVSIYTTGGTGSDVAYAKNLFLGAQGLVWAWGERPKVVAEEFDYGNEHGFGWAIMAKAGKPKFNSLDYGVIGITTARTKISDA